MEEKKFFTTKEAAKYLGISTATIYRMEKQGLISSLRTPGGQRRFNRDNIEKYLKESQSFEAPQNPSRYKYQKTDFKVKEAESAYDEESKKIKSDELFFHTDSTWIYNADILKIESIADNSIDLIVTSPPYNVDIKYNSHNDTMTYEDYLSFTREWLTRCYKFIKNDGRFCLNIPLDKNKGGQQSMCADITTIAKQIGFKYHS
ncbi:MAG: excisionase family DNA-binding protein, partial [Thermodesulfovibrionales bacterium]